MSNQPTHTTVVVQQQGQSALGLAGLILSILGWFTCGLLCIPGAACSALGLFSSKPKTMAIAGLLVGFPGVILFFVVGIGFFGAMLGMGAVGVAVVSEVENMAAENAAMLEAAEGEPEISFGESDWMAEAAVEDPAMQDPATEDPATEDPATEDPAMEDPATEDPAMEDPAMEDPAMEEPATEEPAAEEPVERTFSDASGKFQISATVVAIKDGWVKLKRADTGKEVTVQISKLSADDQAWLAERSFE